MSEWSHFPWEHGLEEDASRLKGRSWCRDLLWLLMVQQLMPLSTYVEKTPIAGRWKDELIAGGASFASQLEGRFATNDCKRKKWTQQTRRIIPGFRNNFILDCTVLEDERVQLILMRTIHASQGQMNYYAKPSVVQAPSQTPCYVHNSLCRMDLPHSLHSAVQNMGLFPELPDSGAVSSAGLNPSPPASA